MNTIYNSYKDLASALHGASSKEPENLAGIRKWIIEHRPDILEHFDQIIRTDIIVLMTIGFEAGRQFQHEHPKLPINNPLYYDNHPPERPAPMVEGNEKLINNNPPPTKPKPYNPPGSRPARRRR